jgi:hypothetical protein
LSLICGILLDSNYGKLLSLVYRLQDCEKLLKKLNTMANPNELFSNFIDEKKNGKLNVTQENNSINITMVTNDRNVRIKGINISQDEESNEWQFSVHVGRQSPYIEIMQHGEYFFLINGLHKLYSLKKSNFTSGIFCVLAEDKSSHNVKHPYSLDIFNCSRPPILLDFFNKNLTFEIELQTSIRHLQLVAQENIIPTYFD